MPSLQNRRAENGQLGNITTKPTVPRRSDGHIHRQCGHNSVDKVVYDEHIERTGRRLVAQNRDHPHVQSRRTAAKSVVGAGIQEARSRKFTADCAKLFQNPKRRACLPPISRTVFSANRKLVRALSAGAEIRDLPHAIAARLNAGDKFSYIEIRDFLSCLRTQQPQIYATLRKDIIAALSASAAVRFQKMCENEPVLEADFIDPA